MPVLSESLLPGGVYPYTFLYFGLGAVVLICCGVALRRTPRTHPSSSTSSSFPQHQDEKSEPFPNQNNNNTRMSNSWQENRSLPLPPLATQPPPYPQSQSSFGANFTYYASPVEMPMGMDMNIDMNPQSYFDEPFFTDEPMSYNSSTPSLSSSSEPSTTSSYSSQPSSYPYYPNLQIQIPLSNRSWFETNPTSYSTSPFPFSYPPLPSESPNSSYSSAGMGMARRRSYTKIMGNGNGEFKGEIMQGEGWRRHTRVFGGGVCRACEESEAKMMLLKMRASVNEEDGNPAVLSPSDITAATAS